MGIVPLVSKHLCHLPCPLPLPHFGLQENPKTDVRTIRHELPPAGDTHPLRHDSVCMFPLWGPATRASPTPAHRQHLWPEGSGLLEGSRTLPEDAAWKENFILHLVGGAPGNLHTVFVPLFHLVSHVILLGDVTPIVDLEAEHGVSWNVHLSQVSLVTSSPWQPIPWIYTWGLHQGQSWCPHTPQAAGQG